VIAHPSFPGKEPKWLTRGAAFATAAGVPEAQARCGITAIKEQLPVFSPEQDAALLREAGFTDIDLFYCAFTFKGWIARRA